MTRVTRRQIAALSLRPATAALLLTFAGSLSACVQYASSDPGFSADPAVRHPIVLASAPSTLDIYPLGGRLDARSRSEIAAFAQRYRRFGSGEILVLTGGQNGTDARAAEEVRGALASAGAPARVAITRYGVDTLGAAPIRVAFTGLKADVPTPCGRWPEDLASGSSLQGWKNEPWENFGCATQATLAAQIDDPRDFVEARPLGSSDVAMRTRAIEAVREGKEPSTEWTKTVLHPIGGGVSGGGGVVD